MIQIYQTSGYKKNIYRSHSETLEAIQDEKNRLNRLVEINVLEQVHNITQTSIIQTSWHKNQLPYIL